MARRSLPLRTVVVGAVDPAAIRRGPPYLPIPVAVHPDVSDARIRACRSSRRTAPLGWECGQRAHVIVRFGCEHEHVYRSAICQRCLTLIEDGKRLFCRPCIQATDLSHACACTVTVLRCLERA